MFKRQTSRRRSILGNSSVTLVSLILKVRKVDESVNIKNRYHQVEMKAMIRNQYNYRSPSVNRKEGRTQSNGTTTSLADLPTKNKQMLNSVAMGEFPKWLTSRNLRKFK